MLKKIVLGFIIVAILSIIGFILFFPLDSFVRGKIENAIGPGISFSNLKIRWNSISADDVLIKTPAGSNFLRIKRLELKPYLWGILRKELEIKKIELYSPRLILKRTKEGRWLLPDFKKKGKEKDKSGDKGSSHAVTVRALEVSNGIVSVIDDTKGFSIDLTDMKIDVKSKLFHRDRITADASARLPSASKISLASEGVLSNEEFKGVLSVKNLDITLLRPYIEGGIRVKKGRLNLDSNISLNKGYVKAPSVLKVRDVNVEAGGIIMGVSAPLVLELIKKEGEISLEFNVWGKWNNLQNDLKESFQKKVLIEVGKTVTSPLFRDVVEGIGSLLPSKK